MARGVLATTGGAQVVSVASVCYVSGAGVTGYPRRLVTHHPRASFGAILKRRPAEGACGWLRCGAWESATALELYG